MHIIPAILPKSFKELEYKVGLVNGFVDTVQVDICDGKFTDSKTWPYLPPTTNDPQLTTPDPDFQALLHEKKGLPFWDSLDYEFDLMVTEPEGVIADFVRMGASRILIHVESTTQLEDIIHEWKDAVEIGLALNPKTPLAGLASFMHEVRVVQLMGSNYLGHHGVELDPSTYERIRQLRAEYPEHIISVDIGVNLETAPDLIAAGADHLVAGSAIFKNPDPVGAIRRFQSMI